MILITSAAYINPSLASELGKLPPCMLPVQNRRLYLHQIALFEASTEDIYISLPVSYELSSHDDKLLAERHVGIVKVPDNLSLGQSIVYSLNSIGRFGETVYILHGDTLFASVDLVPDCYVVARAEDNYSWAEADAMTETVYAGFFAFSSPLLLIKSITEENNDFIAGVNRYEQKCPLKRILSGSWMDFGLVNTYYRSISNLTTQRAFNSMQIDRFAIKKSSHDVNKMMAESNWIQSLPKDLRHYAPAIWDSGVVGDSGFYEMEYYYLSSLANLFVFCRHPQFVLNDILGACQTFISDVARHRPTDAGTVKQIAHSNNELFLPKTLKRLELYAKEVGVSLDRSWKINGVETPSLREIAVETGAMISNDKTEFVTLMHGDFCFSNILYDFKSKSIKVIDPRGIDNDGNMSIYGDLRYDVGKLAHSILGLYDFIIAGLFDYSERTPYDIELEFDLNESILATQESFRRMTFAGWSIDELNVYPILVQLFLSMLPLHNDNVVRQKAMLANALRLYIEIKSKKK